MSKKQRVWNLDNNYHGSAIRCLFKKRGLLIQRTVFYSRLHSLCLHRQTSLHRVFFPFYSNYRCLYENISWISFYKGMYRFGGMCLYLWDRKLFGKQRYANKYALAFLLGGCAGKLAKKAKSYPVALLQGI